MHMLPPNAPANLYEAFSYIGLVSNPAIDDLKLMVVLETVGKVRYDDLAAAEADPNVQAMLTASGLDELKYAERVSAAIGKLTGVGTRCLSGRRIHIWPVGSSRSSRLNS